MGCLLATVACGDRDLPVVARGKLVEIATSREEVVCAGTVEAMDNYVSNVFAALGEVPPDDIFLRYEWLEDSDGSENRAIPTTDGIRVRTDRMMHEHELVHAVHLTAWPRREGYLAEGLAILLEADNGQMPFEWPSSVQLDTVLAADPLDGDLYPLAWFLVSQIVADHGFEGLRKFWFALPETPGPAETRSTYASLFGRPFDQLIAPRSEMVGDVAIEVARTPCFYGVCGGVSTRWSDEHLDLDGPTGCETDTAAIGPTGNVGDIWRRYVVEVEPQADLSVTANGGSGARRRRCGLRCEPSAFGEDVIPADWTGEWPGWSGVYQIDVGQRSDTLPTTQPGSLELRRGPRRRR